MSNFFLFSELMPVRVNTNWHETGRFYLLVLFGSDFVSWFFFKKLQFFFEGETDINQLNLTPCCAHLVLHTIPLYGDKDEHFSCFHSSCQWGLRMVMIFSLWLVTIVLTCSVMQNFLRAWGHSTTICTNFFWFFKSSVNIFTDKLKNNILKFFINSGTKWPAQCTKKFTRLNSNPYLIVRKPI